MNLVLALCSNRLMNRLRSFLGFGALLIIGACSSTPDVDPEKYDIRCVKEHCEASYASCISDKTVISGFSTETMLLCKQRYETCIKGCAKVPSKLN